MEHYITGSTIKKMREKNHLTQAQLAEQLLVTDKTISKWENGRGYPDITLLEPLAKSLKISVTELLSGDCVMNSNISANMMRTKFYVCPICGNIIHTVGNALIGCCGLTLPALEAEDGSDLIQIEKTETDFYVNILHPMTKQDYVSFIAYVTSDRVEIVKLYPEGASEARFFRRGNGWIYCYCNKDGFFSKKIGNTLS